MQKAKPIIIDIMKRLNPISVLDLGCGKCKFSKRFIDKGIDVTGVDKNKLVSSFGNFNFFHQDVLSFKFKKKYDLIIGTGILHFLKKESSCRLIKEIQLNTNLGGFNFLICMSNKEDDKKNDYFYPSINDLEEIYKNWEIIHNTNCLSKKHDEDSHQHKIIIFLARKVK